MRWRIPLVVALVAFVAVSCDQQPVEPPTDQVAEAPALNFMNGPATAGPYVVRGFESWVSWWDYPPEATPDGQWWTVLLGVTHTDEMFFCGGDGTETPISVQNLFKEGSIHDLSVRKNDPAYAFHSADFYTAGGDVIFCGIMELAIAEGTGSVVFVDNDLTGSVTNNVWGHSFNAWLTDVGTDENYHATYKAKWQWRPDTGFFRVLQESGFIN